MELIVRALLLVMLVLPPSSLLCSPSLEPLLVETCRSCIFLEPCYAFRAGQQQRVALLTIRLPHMPEPLEKQHRELRR